MSDVAISTRAVVPAGLAITFTVSLAFTLKRCHRPSARNATADGTGDNDAVGVGVAVGVGSSVGVGANVGVGAGVGVGVAGDPLTAAAVPDQALHSFPLPLTAGRPAAIAKT